MKRNDPVAVYASLAANHTLTSPSLPKHFTCTCGHQQEHTSTGYLVADYPPDAPGGTEVEAYIELTQKTLIIVWQVCK